jgi:hypothetical protein
MVWLQWLPFAVSLVLQILVIGSLRRGGYKDYPFVFIYSLVLIMTTVVDGAAHADASIRDWTQGFYRNEALRQLLLFTVVMSLMDRAIAGRVYRGRIRFLLIASATAAVLVSVSIHWGSHLKAYSLWATQVGRDLSFGSVVLTLLLWVTLISSRRKDTQLLMVTGGLGLQFTGEAIGQSIRQLSHHNRTLLFVGNGLMIASHLIRLYVWREAFRTNPVRQQVKKEPDENVTDCSPQAHQTLAETIA